MNCYHTFWQARKVGVPTLNVVIKKPCLLFQSLLLKHKPAVTSLVTNSPWVFVQLKHYGRTFGNFCAVLILPLAQFQNSILYLSLRLPCHITGLLTFSPPHKHCLLLLEKERHVGKETI